jgi:hypothetical protein
VLSLPLFLGAAFFASYQMIEPSGRYVVELPVGTEAWVPDLSSTAERQVAEALISEQESAGIAAPNGYIITGKPIGTTRLNDTDWTKFQLRDGREIGIASTDTKVISKTAENFLWSEKARGQRYTDKDNIQFDGARVAFLDFWNQDFPVNGPWPKHRQREWTIALLLAAGGFVVYLSMRLIAWVIAGFAAPPPTRVKQ